MIYGHISSSIISFITTRSTISESKICQPKKCFFCIFSVDQIFDRLLWVQETSLFFPALQHHGAPPPSFTIHTSTVDGGFTCLLRYKSISSHKICRAHQELCSVRKGAAQARGPQLYLALCCWYKLLVQRILFELYWY